MVLPFVPGRVVGVTLGVAVLACQGSNLTLPSDSSPSSLEAVSGDGQRGTVGTTLPESLVVRVTDASGNPVPGVPLRFEADVPALQVDPALPTTDDSGKAAVQVTLGLTEGTQTIEALLAQGTSAELKTSFALIAVAGQQPDDDDDGDDEGNDEGPGGAGNDDDKEKTDDRERGKQDDKDDDDEKDDD